jgi:hypothetical protein
MAAKPQPSSIEAVAKGKVRKRKAMSQGFIVMIKSCSEFR